MLERFRFPFKAMGGPAEIQIVADDWGTAEAAFRGAWHRIAAIESKYSRYKLDSLISRINAAAGTNLWIECDEETSSLLDYADRLYIESDGLFDLTSGVLRNHWNFHSTDIPSEKSLRAALELIGWRKVERREFEGRRNLVRLPTNGMEIDLGGLAKEFAVDESIREIKKLSLKGALVNLAGDIAAIGHTESFAAWSIGIKHPTKVDLLSAQIQLTNASIATSGLYERNIISNGIKYGHILNPLTGWPSKGWESITVVHAQAISAGAISTIGILKENKAIDFLDSKNVRYLAIDERGNVYRK